MDGPAGVKWRGQGANNRCLAWEIRGVKSVCDARYDALSPDRVELLTRAVILVAGMTIPEATREAALTWVMEELAAASERLPEASTGADAG